MYTITVERDFCAAHAISIAGQTEPIHGHNWHVTATVAATTLDSDGLVCDFHTIDRTLKSICEPFHNRNLNEVPPFDATNPTAELVAKHIADELHAALGEALAPNATIQAVAVTECPGCTAIYTRA